MNQAEKPLRSAGHLAAVETESFTQGMARVWRDRDRTAPPVPYGGYGYEPRFWCPPAELVAAARRAIADVEAGEEDDAPAERSER